jgi:hypothetical protein
MNRFAAKKSRAPQSPLSLKLYFMALRQQVLIDKSVQGVLVGRVVLYWICGLLYVGIGTACFQLNQNPDWTMQEHASALFSQVWPWLPTAILVLPLAIYDVIRLSNLFAGPIYRLRRHFKLLSENIAAEPLKFRTDDYWADIPGAINDMHAEILRLRTRVIELQDEKSNEETLAAKALLVHSVDINAEVHDDPQVDKLPGQPFEPSSQPAFSDETAVPIATKLTSDIPVASPVSI